MTADLAPNADLLVAHLDATGRHLLDRVAQRRGIVGVHEIEERAGQEIPLGPPEQSLIASAHPAEVAIEPRDEIRFGSAYQLAERRIRCEQPTVGCNTRHTRAPGG